MFYVRWSFEKILWDYEENPKYLKLCIRKPPKHTSIAIGQVYEEVDSGSRRKENEKEKKSSGF